MKRHQIATLVLVVLLLVFPWHMPKAEQSPTVRLLASESMSMDNRQPAHMVNEVFRDNILLTVSYLSGRTKAGLPVNWDEVRKPGSFEFTVSPGGTFAFHDEILSQYKGSVQMTTRANFGPDQGFKSDGYLMGDGVCHLASLMNWVAKEAKLNVDAPTSHNFAVIPGIDAKYGTSIYSAPQTPGAGAQQNLYITNNTGHTVSFMFTYDGHNLSMSASQYE